MKKETLVQLIIIIFLTVILSGIIWITAKEMNSRDDKMYGMNPMEEETVKDTKKEDVDKGSEVEVNNINLNEYNSNINISKGGEYNITGEFEYSIIVDSTEKVTLNLNNVTINCAITSAIANINSGELVINLEDNTINILKDNGSSEYDGCIYSERKLTIEGNGVLEVYGNQEEEEGEGIATETNDITINGGEVIALGSDMLQNPDNTSNQKYISFTLNSNITNNSNISLKDSVENEIISFEAKEDFKTIIISNSKLTSGTTYYLYINGEKTEYNQIVK